MAQALTDLIHVVLFLACWLAAFRVVPSFQALINLHPLTSLSGTAFFVLAGIENLGLAVHEHHVWLFILSSYLQAVSIVVFLVMLTLDLRQALKRLRMAFMAIRHHYKKDGDRVIATVTTALQGKNGYRDPVTRK